MKRKIKLRIRNAIEKADKVAYALHVKNEYDKYTDLKDAEQFFYSSIVQFEVDAFMLPGKFKSCDEKEGLYLNLLESFNQTIEFLKPKNMEQMNLLPWK